MTKIKRIKAKKRQDDYKRKSNIMKNNIPRKRRFVLTAGDEILPKSRKYFKQKKKNNF